MKKLLLTTEEWLHLKWMLERNMIRMDADAFRLKEGEPGSEARREAIGKELERIEKEHRNIERMLEKIEAAETVQTATDETEEQNGSGMSRRKRPGSGRSDCWRNCGTGRPCGEWRKPAACGWAARPLCWR